MTDYSYNHLEQNLAEVTKQKEYADRLLLHLEIFIGTLVTVILLALVLVASLIPMATWLSVCLISLGFITFIVGVAFALKIEQVAGYYKCSKCGHKHIPAYSNILWAPHICRARYMKCPKCNEKSWQKKVLSKD